jgi:hypothetical protein
VQIPTLVQISLLHGLSLTLLLFLIMGFSFALAPDMWVGDYPPDIRERYGSMSQQGKRYRPVVGVLFLGAILLVVVHAALQLETLIRPSSRFVDYLLSNFIILMTFNLSDLLIADWLVFVTIQPKVLVLPGTEGMAGYRDFRFHFRGFLIGTVSSAVAAATLAGIAVGVAAVLY